MNINAKFDDLSIRHLRKMVNPFFKAPSMMPNQFKKVFFCPIIKPRRIFKGSIQFRNIRTPRMGRTFEQRLIYLQPKLQAHDLKQKKSL